MGATNCIEVDDAITKDKSKSKRWPLPFKKTADLCGKFVIDDAKFSAEFVNTNGPKMIQKWMKSNQQAIIAVLDMNNAHFYQSFQKEVSSIIPIEGERPSVQVVIKDTQNPDIPPLFTFGFLGGMGPLADAEVLMRTIKYIKLSKLIPNDMKKRIELKVCSEPQPFASYHGGVQDIKSKSFYHTNAAEFLRDPYIQTFEITCNTAHSNMHLYDAIQVGGSSNPFGKGRRMFVDIIATTTALINQIKYEYLTPNNAKILIIGTNKAYDKKLYQNAFDNCGFEHVDIDFMHKLIIDGKEIDEDKCYVLIGNAIKKIKKGNIDEGKRDLLQLISDIAESDKNMSITNSIQYKPINVVAFSCSEVSLSISAKDVVNIGADLYKNAYVVDTTELMAINAYNEILKEYNKWMTTLSFMKSSGAMPIKDDNSDVDDHKSVD